MKTFRHFKESIIDIPRRTYAPGVFDDEDTNNPKIKDSVLRLITQQFEDFETDNVEVFGAHCGMGFNAAIYYIIADRLAQPRDDWKKFKRCKLEKSSTVLLGGVEPGRESATVRQKSMREFKKYPNRRLYDIEESKYVTVEDIRKLVLKGEVIRVLDSKTEKDLTRSVLLQIITEQESEGHEPILTNRVLEQLIRFYGAPMQNVVSKYIEQSIKTLLEHEQNYRQRMQDFSPADPMGLMRKALEQNMEFWNRLTNSSIDNNSRDKQP